MQPIHVEGDLIACSHFQLEKHSLSCLFSLRLWDNVDRFSNFSRASNSIPALPSVWEEVTQSGTLHYMAAFTWPNTRILKYLYGQQGFLVLASL